MNHKKIKIIGIVLCTLVVGMLLPAVMATPAEPPVGEPAIKLPLAMIMGKITNVHKLGKIVWGHAVRLRYFGLDLDRGIDHGVLRNQFVMFHDAPRFHMFRMGENAMVFGHVQRLRFFI